MLLQLIRQKTNSHYRVLLRNTVQKIWLFCLMLLPLTAVYANPQSPLPTDQLQTRPLMTSYQSPMQGGKLFIGPDQKSVADRFFSSDRL